MHEVNYKQIGQRIRHKRKERDWTQDELAKKCHVSMAFIGHIERGTRIMSMDTFVTICNVLDTSADELLWDTFRVSNSKVQQMLDLTESRNPKDYGLYVRIMESVAEAMTKESQAEALIKESQAETLIKESQAETLIKKSQAKVISDESMAESIKKSQTEAMTRESIAESITPQTEVMIVT